MMIESIGVQHVRRRQRSSSAAVKPNKPLDKIKQHPVHKKRSRPGKSRVSNQKVPPVLTATKKVSGSRFDLRTALKSLQTAFERGRDRFIPAFLRLMYPALITVTISLLILILYCSFIKTDNSENAFIVPREDSRFQMNMASYAGFYPQGAPPQETETSETIPLDLTETFAWQTYTVKAGDSVSKIAADYGISLDAIIASNGITNARRLDEGQVIKIPNMDGIPYTVKNGDNLLKISDSMKIPLAAILDANDVQSETITPGTVLFIPGARMKTEDLKLVLGELFIYPIRGRLTSPYGWRNDPISGVRRFHAAIDLASPTGTPIKAAMDGRVSSVGFNSTYGKFIIISHNNGFQTMYAHMSVTSVIQGSYVNQGTKIGEVGSTGYSTGPHLHFAVFKNGRAVNPIELLSP
jgi:murein DD-endopeptidase MepM/ murein hydrolase activator NlpD